MRDTLIGYVLGILAAIFVLLLAGAGSGLLTEDPPEVSPYASSGEEGEGSAGNGFGYGDDTEEATTTAGQAAEPDIVIEGFAFSDPDPVPVGAEVTVVNQDSASHTWTSRDGVWDSGTLSEGESFTVVIEEPGEYEFFCSFHPSMEGSITVEG